MIVEKIKLYLIIAGVTLALGVITNGVTAYKFYGYGKAKVQAEWAKASLATVGTKLKTKAKQDEIKNAPVDDAVTDRRLFNATF